MKYLNMVFFSVECILLFEAKRIGSGNEKEMRDEKSIGTFWTLKLPKIFGRYFAFIKHI